MIRKQPKDIVAADITGLVEQRVRENREIEYKRQLPTNSEADKKDFLADVSSFANAVGGDIYYGIEATDGIPTAATGLGGVIEDAELLRLESMLRDGLDPRIPGLQLEFVRGLSKGPALIIRIPRSWAAPHMVIYSGVSRFFTRHTAGKAPMDVGELRSAFGVSDTLPDLIRRWRDERPRPNCG